MSGPCNSWDSVYLEMSYMLEAEEIIDMGSGGNLTLSCSLRSMFVSTSSQVSSGFGLEDFHEELCKQERFVSLTYV